MCGISDSGEVERLAVRQIGVPRTNARREYSWCKIHDHNLVRTRKHGISCSAVGA
jgi:hypothetical protein